MHRLKKIFNFHSQMLQIDFFGCMQIYFNRPRQFVINENENVCYMLLLDLIKLGWPVSLSVSSRFN